MVQPWFRMYRAAAHNPKVQRMGLELIGFWVNCLCLSDDDGQLPNDMDLAWQMRLATQEVQGMMNELVRHGLVTRDSHGRSRLHDWEIHQKRSDYDPTARERKARQREREKVRETGKNSNVTRDVTDMSRSGHTARTDKIREKKELTSFVPKKSSDRGTRWPDGGIVPEDWVQAGREARQRAGMPSINFGTQADMFSNYWSAKSGAGATKLDWRKTWINWCLNAKGDGNVTRQQGRVGGTIRDIVGEIGELEKVRGD